MEFSQKLDHHPDFVILAPTTLNLICFQYRPNGMDNQNQLNQLNEALMHSINDSGKMYITHTKLNEKFALRLVAGQTNLQERHMEEAWAIILNATSKINQQQ